MAAGRLIIPGFMPATDRNGDRIAGAKLFWYADETTTLQDTFTTSELSVRHANPVVADDVGTFPPMWANTTATFSVAATDADDVPVPGVSYDGISPSVDATLASVALAESAADSAEAAAAAIAVDQAAIDAAVLAASASATAAAASAADAEEIAGFTPGNYQLLTGKDAANGYAGLTAAGKINDAQLTEAPVSTDQQAALDLKLDASERAEIEAFAIAAAVAL